MNADLRASLTTARIAGRAAWVAASLLMASTPAAGQTKTNYDEIYARYLNAARSQPAPDGQWLANLDGDPNARHVNDLVTIRVVESLSATGSADSSVDKASTADVKMPSPASKALEKVFPTTSTTKFAGSGGTTRTTQLTAVVTARVTEVLPNGDLAVESIREIDINGDRSLVVLSGVIRPSDIQPGNVISSTQVGQLRIRSLSQGLIRDSLTPGWLVKALNKVF